MVRHLAAQRAAERRGDGGRVPDPAAAARARDALDALRAARAARARALADAEALLDRDLFAALLGGHAAARGPEDGGGRYMAAIARGRGDGAGGDDVRFANDVGPRRPAAATADAHFAAEAAPRDRRDIIPLRAPADRAAADFFMAAFEANLAAMGTAALAGRTV